MKDLIISIVLGLLTSYFVITLEINLWLILPKHWLII